MRAWSVLGARVLLAIWVWASALEIKYHLASGGLDPSGGFTFNYAHAHGLIFGRDVAFTYGPLAYLALPMPVGNNLRQGILFQFLLWLVFVAVTGWLFFGRRVRLEAMLLFALGFFFGRDVFRNFGYVGPDMYLVYLGMLLLGASVAGGRWPFWYGGAAIVCVAAFFVKFSSAAMLAATMAIFAVSLLTVDRRKGWRALLLVAALPAAIFTVHGIFFGSPLWLWRYVRVALEMSAGYGVAMSEGGDSTATALAVAILVAWLAAALVLWWRRVNSWGLALACVGPLFLEFKHSFAREAGHIDIFFLFLPLLWGLVALFTEVRRKDMWYVAGAFALVLALWYPRHAARVAGLLDPFAPLRNFARLADLGRLDEVERAAQAGSAAVLSVDRLPAELLARVGRSPIAIFPMECSYGGASIT